MAKAKSSDMPHYELLYIISNKFSESEVLPIKETILKLINDNQGTITFQQNWGKKKLAYPIKHFRHGYYQLLEFDMPASAVKNVDNNLRLSDQILRHQIVIKDQAGTPDGLAAVMAAQAAKAPQSAVAKQPATTKTVAPDAQPQATPEKVDIKELDDKLDKILDSESFF